MRPAAESPSVLFATGSYTSEGRGKGEGIGLWALDASGDRPGIRRLATVRAEDPSALCWSEDGALLYAVLETSPSRLLALAVTGADDAPALELRAELALTGSGGCHLSPGRRPGTLLIAHYGSGSVETVALDGEGMPTEAIDLDDHHEAAEGAEPHPHQVRPLDGSELIAVPDLGLDRIFLYRQDHAGQIALESQISLPRGSGPRHLTADHESSQLFVSCERSGAVAAAVRRQVPQPVGGLQLMRGPEYAWSVSSVVPATRTDVEDAVSHLELTADEEALLVANRGPDTLALFSLAGMRPELVTEVPVGAHPRHFTQHGDLVLVAAQEDDRIDLLRRRGEELAPAAESIPAPSVTFVAIRPA